ncbi:DUF4304 domain-containing protein [Rhodococcus hoagii]|nr:DUF4304 domain-containing protein [Prescottella equi]MBM4521616.1 DUF4304 domain-containing protein [Prescottella equi]MBM4528615.1 DUF4304 domain-containing protein [Prescottella equi]MBM4545687.1 DUF4304 domain-containing protein [Prescottella equi]MBM4572452.1 DUF4304 domain-containing protein [Prescottella equi]
MVPEVPEGDAWVWNDGVMTSESAERAFSSVVGTGIAPLLKSHGFRKQKLTFTRDRDGLVDVVNLQRSAGNNNESIRFYVNCGVYSAEFDRVIGRVPEERPKEVDCQYRRRIEHIAPGVGPHVTVTTDTDVPAVAEQMRVALVAALDVMGRLGSPDDVARAVDSDIDFDVFRYRLASGDEVGAREQFARARTEFGSEERWPRLEVQFRKAEAEYEVPAT